MRFWDSPARVFVDFMAEDDHDRLNERFSKGFWLTEAAGTMAI
jgi:hypothetical protein